MYRHIAEQIIAFRVDEVEQVIFSHSLLLVQITNHTGYLIQAVDIGNGQFQRKSWRFRESIVIKGGLFILGPGLMQVKVLGCETGGIRLKTLPLGKSL